MTGDERRRDGAGGVGVSERVARFLNQLRTKTLSASAGKDESRRPYGLCSGEFIVTEAFDEPLPEDLLRAFEGR